MAGLPRIDEHAVEIAADRDVVWRALLAGLPGSGRGRAGTIGARVLGCRQTHVTGAPGEVGSTVIGFRVARSVPGRELALEGCHRFSEYRLTFFLEPLGSGRTRLRAATDAAFPSLAGRVYSALVIGSGLHVRAINATLDAIRRRAEC